MGMKVKDIKSALNEAINTKMKISEDSHFEGYNFVTYGKEISAITMDLPLIQIDKNSVIIKWVGRMELHNDGVYGFEIDVKSLAADGDDGPLNFNGFDFIMKKTKNPEATDIQVFIDSVFVATQEKKIYVEFLI